jgi:murein DD-endopeptidase MepM/ murein hydrolase activator NlpD
MSKIKKLIRIIVTIFAVAIIFGLMGLVGSSTSTASGGNTNFDKNSMLSSENYELNEKSNIYGDFMTELYPVITGESVDFKNLPSDSIKKYLTKITDLYPNVSPIKGLDTFNLSSNVSSGFGWRIHPITHKKSFHTGVDIDMPMYTKIYATMSGKVIEVKYTTKTTYGQGYGNYIIVKNNLGFETLYAHLSAIYVKEGQTIDKGQLVANLGRTGNATGPCLHYEVIQANERKNPMDSLFMNYQMKLLAKK